MKKVLIIGVKGMAGHVLKSYFSNMPNYDVFGIARDIKESEKIFNLDVSDVNILYEIIQDNSFDVIINCIGILNNDAEENPSKAVWFNSFFPHLIEKWTKDTKTKFIHISTDCVFFGEKRAVY